MEFLQLLFESIPVPIFYKDTNGIYKECNNAFAEYIGLKKEEIIGKSVYDISPKELANIYYEADYKLLSKRNVIFNKAVIVNDEGEAEGLVGAITDITERKLYEEELQHSLKEYQKVFDLLPEAVIIQDYEGNIEYANKSTVKLVGAKKVDDLFGKSIIDLISKKDIYVIKDKLKNILNDESIPYYPVKLKCFNEDMVDIEVAFILQNFLGKKYILAILKNVTEQKLIEKERLKMEKLESVGLLAGGIAHDFNNILTIIQGNTSLLKFDINERKYDKLLFKIQEIEKAVQQSKNLTQQLLTFSKGGYPVKESVSIEDLVKETTSLALSGSNVRCKYLFSERLYSLEIDKGQISQVINNLIINSVHSMPEGGIIKVGIENIDLNENYKKILPLKDGKYIKIYVKDEGIGIPKKYLQKVFDPYFTTKQEGSGLGLATSYSIVKKHNGHIFVESNVGYGSTFYIYLPAVTNKKILSKEKKNIVKGKGKILLMDDSKFIREVTGEMLKEIGYDVDFAKDGVEAVKLYKNNKNYYDLFIMDLTIPGGKGGKWTIDIIKKLNPEIKAIVISGYANDPVISNYSDYGFDGYLIKPFEIEDLSKTVYDIISENKGTKLLI